MNYGEMHNLGALAAAGGLLAPVAGTGSAQAGAALSRLGFYTAVALFTYSTSGGVTGGTAVAKLQHSADGSTGWTDYGDAVTVTLSGTNPSGLIKVPVNLSSAKLYVRPVIDIDATGGTPASIVAGAILLSGKDRL